MSKFYGTVMGQARTDATRRGTNDIRAAAQSWDGSIISELTYDEDGDLHLTIYLNSSSSAYGRTAWRGKFNDFADMLGCELNY